MGKRIMMTVLGIVLLITVAFAVGAEAQTVDALNAVSGAVLDFASGTPACPYCGSVPADGWTALDTDIDSWKRLNGHYYLAGNRENSDYYAVVGGNACVYLGDYKITATNQFAFQVEGGTLTLMGRGTVTGNHNQYATVGATIDVVAGNLNLCGGTYQKGTANGCAVLTVRGDNSLVSIYDGTVIQNGDADTKNGGNIRVSKAATVCMYGGVIRDGVAANGGNIALEAENAVFHMYGGSVSGGQALLSDGSVTDGKNYTFGGNLYIPVGSVTMEEDAAVSGGCAFSGGNLYIASGTEFKSAGLISGGTASTGGNLDVRGGSKLVLTGTVSGGTATYDGGNLQILNAQLELAGGKIIGGKADRWGGSVLVDGSNGSAVLTQGRISGGKTTDGFGGNLCVLNGASVQICGATVTGGNALNQTSGKGGNIYIGEATFSMTGGAVTWGKAGVSGGNIHCEKSAQEIPLAGCDINHGEAPAGGNICMISTPLRIAANVTVTDGISQWPSGSDFPGGGGNIYAQSGNVYLSGKVSGGWANRTGGNIELRSGILFLLDSATVADGEAQYDGGNISAINNGVVCVDTASVTGGTAGRNGDGIYAEGRVILQHNAQVSGGDGIYFTNSAKLLVEGNFTGSADVCGLTLPDPLYGGVLDSSLYSCTSAYTGKIWLTEISDRPYIYGNGTQLYVTAVSTWKDGVKTWYATNADAVANYGDADYLVPVGDLVLDGGEYVVDLAGQALKITGTGKLICFDSSNDSYKDYGSAVINGPTLQNAVAQTVNGKHYVRIKTDGAYSFHRMNLKVSDISLRISNGGIYYSAQWECDDSILPLISSYGIGVSVADMPTEMLRTDADTKHTKHDGKTFESGIKTNGVLIRNILLDAEDAGADRVALNGQYAMLPVYAKAYVVLDNGIEREQTLISNDNVAFSLHNVIESIDNNMPLYFDYSETLKGFLAYWAQYGLTGSDWDFAFSVPVQVLALQQKYSGTEGRLGQLYDRQQSSDHDLQNWKTDIQSAGIDFASLLENGSVANMSSSDWDCDSFIGGIEAAIAVDGKTVHCNLLFASLEDVRAVLSENSAFSYNAGAGTFQYNAVDDAGFKALISSVQSHNGLFLLAHPKEVGLIDSRDALDYWFADGTAVDVFCEGTAEQNYKLWTDLLMEGKRVWATASNAGDFKENGGTLAVYTAEETAAAYLARLRSGDFACGPVGIRMAVGDITMGGSGTFAGKDLVFGLEVLNGDALDFSHSYRVDLITKEGIVQSWQYAGKPMYQVLEADDRQAFYRLEVIDETTGQRVAVGNPIWNDSYGLKAGFAREEITPDYQVMIVGGNQRPSEGVKDGDGIFLTCVALQEGTQTYLIYTADLINADSGRFVSPAQRAIAQATGVPVGNIIISTTHTHSSVGIGLDHWTFNTEYDGDANLAQFRSDFYDAAVRTAQAAIADLSPVDAAYAGSVTDKKDVAFVRHYVKMDGTPDYSNDGTYDTGTIFNSYKWQYKAHAANADQQIQLVKFQRAGDKKDVVLMSVPAHATLNENSKQLSADFPLYARQYIENNTESLVAYFIGAAGDQVPRSKLSDYYLNRTLGVSNNTDAATYGKKLGQYAVAVLGNLTQLESTTIKSTPATFTGKINARNLELYDTASELLSRVADGETITKSQFNAYGFESIYDARYTVYRYEQNAKYGSDMTMRIKTMAIGDLGFVFAPYEMSGVNGMQIKEGSPYKNTFVATCSNDSVSYVASQIAFENLSYEAQCTWFESGSGELLAKQFIQTLEKQKYNEQ